MRKNYPLLSQELNDKILTAYEHLVYLLGFDAEGEDPYSGVYPLLETSGNLMYTSISGIPSAEMPKVQTMLKFDYIYRKHYGEIKYVEK